MAVSTENEIKIFIKGVDNRYGFPGGVATFSLQLHQDVNWIIYFDGHSSVRVSLWDRYGDYVDIIMQPGSNNGSVRVSLWDRYGDYVDIIQPGSNNGSVRVSLWDRDGHYVDIIMQPGSNNGNSPQPGSLCDKEVPMEVD